MKADHIDNRKLYEVVTKGEILEEEEIDHLSNCEECLEMIRIFIRQKVSPS
jgi:hypothetical protein